MNSATLSLPPAVPSGAGDDGASTSSDPDAIQSPLLTPPASPLLRRAWTFAINSNGRQQQWQTESERATRRLRIMTIIGTIMIVSMIVLAYTSLGHIYGASHPSDATSTPRESAAQDVDDTIDAKLQLERAALLAHITAVQSQIDTARMVAASNSTAANATTASSLNESPPRLLVIYVFSNNDQHYLDNLIYFIKTAVRAHQEIDYVFVLNQNVVSPEDEEEQDDPDQEEPPTYDPFMQPWRNGADIQPRFFPELPPNAMYVDHPNECFDLGTVGWFLDTADYARAVRANGGVAPTTLVEPPHWSNSTSSHVRTDTRAYDYFMVINSSVRGPILPTYFDLDSRDQYWYYPFLRMMQIDPELKLVGCTATCIFSPHVQSYVLFTDQSQDRRRKERGGQLRDRRDVRRENERGRWLIRERSLGCASLALPASLAVLLPPTSSYLLPPPPTSSHLLLPLPLPPPSYHLPPPTSSPLLLPPSVFSLSVGLSLIRSSGSLSCPSSMRDAVLDGEISASWSILRAGWNIGALSLLQQAGEWRMRAGLDSDYCTRPDTDKSDLYKRTEQSSYDLVFHKRQVRGERPMLRDADEVVRQHEAVSARRRELAQHRGRMRANVSKEQRQAWEKRKEQWKRT